MAPWPASRPLCQHELLLLTDKHRSPPLPAPQWLSGLAEAGSAQPDFLQVFVRRRGFVCVQSEAEQEELNPLQALRASLLPRKGLVGPPDVRPGDHHSQNTA